MRQPLALQGQGKVMVTGDKETRGQSHLVLFLNILLYRGKLPWMVMTLTMVMSMMMEEMTMSGSPG